MKDLMQRTWAGNPMPARLDVAQSVTGLLLGLFMWVHLFLVSTQEFATYVAAGAQYDGLN